LYGPFSPGDMTSWSRTSRNLEAIFFPSRFCKYVGQGSFGSYT
jgi:hypothetical protein